MKLLYISEHRFIKDEDDNIYTTGSTTNKYFNRYKCFADSIVLVAAAEPMTNANKCKVISKIDSNDGFLNLKIEEIDKSNFITRGKKIKKNIKHQIDKCDAVVMKVPSADANYVLHMCKTYNKPLMFEVVGCAGGPLWDYGNIKGKILAPIMYIKTRLAIKRVPFALYVSRSFLQDKYPNKGYNKGCPDVILDIPSEDVLKKRLQNIEQIKNKKIYTIGMYGYLETSYRGFDVAMKMLLELKNRGINAKLKILGGGNKDKWVKFAQKLGILNDVEFCGTLPSGQTIFNWIDNIDIIVMPTKQETLGRFVIEAMSRGCPVLGTKETALREQLSSDCLFNVHDYIMLADMIQRMLKDTDYTTYCAKENFYRSFKYTNEQTDKIRNDFYKKFASSVEDK